MDHLKRVTRKTESSKKKSCYSWQALADIGDEQRRKIKQSCNLVLKEKSQQWKHEVVLWNISCGVGTPPKFNIDSKKDGPCKTYFLSSVAIFGIYVIFQGLLEVWHPHFPCQLPIYSSRSVLLTPWKNQRLAYLKMGAEPRLKSREQPNLGTPSAGFRWTKVSFISSGPQASKTLWGWRYDWTPKTSKNIPIKHRTSGGMTGRLCCIVWIIFVWGKTALKRDICGSFAVMDHGRDLGGTA